MLLMLTAAAAAVKILLCKAISLVLLCGWVLTENRKPGAVPARTGYRKLEKALVWIYGIAAVLSSAISAILLGRLRFRHSLLIAAAFLAGGAIGACWRWKTGHARQKLTQLFCRAERNICPEQLPG